MEKAKPILVVDDDQALRSALRTKFENKGYTIKEAANGIEALAMLNEEEFSCIMLDLHMPGKNGFEVLEAIRSTKNAHVPVYIVTNLGTETFCKRALDLGARHCFVKSVVTLRDIVTAVDKELHLK